MDEHNRHEWALELAEKRTGYELARYLIDAIEVLEDIQNGLGYPDTVAENEERWALADEHLRKLEELGVF